MRITSFFMALLLLLTLSLGLTGCNRKTDDKDKGNVTTTQRTTTTTASTTAPTTAGTTAGTSDNGTNGTTDDRTDTLGEDISRMLP